MGIIISAHNSGPSILTLPPLPEPLPEVSIMYSVAVVDWWKRGVTSCRGEDDEQSMEVDPWGIFLGEGFDL